MSGWDRKCWWLVSSVWRLGASPVVSHGLGLDSWTWTFFLDDLRQFAQHLRDCHPGPGWSSGDMDDDGCKSLLGPGPIEAVWMAWNYSESLVQLTFNVFQHTWTYDNNIWYILTQWNICDVQSSVKILLGILVEYWCTSLRLSNPKPAWRCTQLSTDLCCIQLHTSVRLCMMYSYHVLNVCVCVWFMRTYPWNRSISPDPSTWIACDWRFSIHFVVFLLNQTYQGNCKPNEEAVNKPSEIQAPALGHEVEGWVGSGLV